MDENSSPPLAKNKFLIGGVIIFVLIVLTGFIYILSKSKSQAQNPNSTNVSPTSDSSNFISGKNLDTINKDNFTKTIVSALPKVDFAAYSMNATFPALKPEVNVFSLKNDFNQTDATRLASHFGMKGNVVSDGTSLVYIKDETSKSNTKFLNFDKKNGSFFFYATDGMSTGETSTDPKVIAKNYLTRVGIFDDTMVVQNLFRRAATKNLSYVEIHRDWGKLGLPLLNTVGVLNLAEQNRLASLHLGEISSTAAIDKDIIFSEDGMAGKARPDDFNTILVTVDNRDGHVVSVMSNMRTITQTQQVQQTDMKTPEQAYAELQNQKSIFSLTLPTGAGYISPDKLYPQGKASASSARISDFVLVYLDNLPINGKPSYVPYYAFRGTATLNSGYRTQFVQVVPALKNAPTSVLGVEAPTPTPTYYPTSVPVTIGITVNPTTEASSIQYATIIGLTGIPITVPVQGPPNVPPGSDVMCPAFKYEYNVPGGMIAATQEYVDLEGNLVRNWFYIPNDTNETIDISQFTCKADCGERGNRGSPREDGTGPAYNGLCGYSTEVCPATKQFDQTQRCVYVSTASPSLYLYPIAPLSFSVAVYPTSKLLVVDPLFTNQDQNMWSGTALPNGDITLTNAVNVNRLYYEYERTQLLQYMKKTAHSTVATIKKSKLSDYLQSDLFLKLGLNKTEAKDLLDEVKRETATVTSEYVQISFIPENVLNTYLPLTISPTPDRLTRIHLFITPSNKVVQNKSVYIPKIVRLGYTAVETGVLVDN